SQVFPPPRDSSMRNKFAVLALMAVVCLVPSATAGRAAVVVLANRSEDEVRFTISSSAGALRPCTLAKGDVMAIPMTRGIEIAFLAGGKRHRCRVRGNEIYCFVGAGESMRLKQVGFTGTWSRPEQLASDDGDSAVDRQSAKNAKVLVTVPVKILVDQAEPTVQKVWEKRLRRRVKEASDILEKCCRVRLKVIEAGTWESDPKQTKLSELLRDFREKVAAGEARLVLGFTGLRVDKKEDAALGCTPRPLHTHILMREWKLRTEPERLEVLVHELGHFLGACHSPESDSVMRPKLGDGRANLRVFRIGFDPVNTLVMNLVAEELARRPLRSLDELSPRTRKRLLDILATLARTAPDDPAAVYFIRLLGGTPPEPLSVRTLPPEVLDGARSVVAAVLAAARRNQQRPASGSRRRLTGDALTESYCRVAAAECRRLPAEQAATIYVLGLAVALDYAALLRALDLRGIDWKKMETAGERARRQEVLGQPAMHGRPSLLRSFVVSAAVLMLVEGQAVSPAGLQEELLLVQGGDRFRFDDLSASLAGITFATQLDASPTLLDELATSFRVADYVLPPKNLPDSLDREEFARKYGSTTDERFLDRQDALRKRLLALPGYQPRPSRKEGGSP
ncbi:MAG: hypothetical protein ACRELG_01695, partial [Gemmataceae bacterium]